MRSLTLPLFLLLAATVLTPLLILLAYMGSIFASALMFP
jgi:hypothetical protein